MKLQKTTTKYYLGLRKQRQELIKNWTKQPQRRFRREDFAIHLIMDSRTVSSVEFKSRLGFKNQDTIMTQEQSILTKIREIFSAEGISYQHFVLGYKIDEYFLKCKLAVEVDKRGHNDRDLESEIERQKALERELNCKFIRINPSRENFNINNGISRIHNCIVKAREKFLLEKTSNRLLSLEFKSDHSIKRKCLKWIVKKVFHEFNN